MPIEPPRKFNLTGDGKATRIRLLDFSSAPMRAFHLSWFAFFLSFMAWFGIAPLMAVASARGMI